MILTSLTSNNLTWSCTLQMTIQFHHSLIVLVSKVTYMTSHLAKNHRSQAWVISVHGKGSDFVWL